MAAMNEDGDDLGVGEKIGGRIEIFEGLNWNIWGEKEDLKGKLL